jgi:hypothetical protein
MLMPRESQGPFHRNVFSRCPPMFRVKCVGGAEDVRRKAARLAALANLFDLHHFAAGEAARSHFVVHSWL